MDERNAFDRVGGLAAGQSGRVARWQLFALGLKRGRIDAWRRRGYLRDTGIPAVYAVGHLGRTVESGYWEAVLYAGPGAAVSHGSGAHWCGLIRYPPATIHVSTPRRCVSLPGITVHARRRFTRMKFGGIPVTSPSEIMRDLAGVGNDRMVRRALAQLEFRALLTDELLHEIEGWCTSGWPGRVRLARCLAHRNPQLARTKSEAEDLFIEGCEDRGISPLPLSNAFVVGIEVDAFWPDHGLVVEIDGDAAHRFKPRRREDRRKEITLRKVGLEVRRYDPVMVEFEGDSVYGEVIRDLEAREGWSERHPSLDWHL